MRSTSNPLRHLILAVSALACLRLGAQAPPAVPALPAGPVEANPPGAATPAERFLARLKDPPPAAFFMAYGESSRNFELRCFAADPSVRTPVVSRHNTLLDEELGKRGIEIPFPTRDVHLNLKVDAAIRSALGGKPQAEEESSSTQGQGNPSGVGSGPGATPPG